MKYSLKEILILIYVLVGSDFYIDRITQLGFSLKGVLFIGLWFICLFGLIAAANIQNNIYRFLYALILFVASIFSISFENISVTFLSYNGFISLINAHGFALEAFIQFFSPIIDAFLISLLLFVALILKPKNKAFFYRWLPGTLPVFVVFLLMTLFFTRGGDGGKGLPPAFVSLAYSGLAGYEALTTDIGEKKGIEIERNEKAINYDIIFIIDESISPVYFDINSKYGVLTNLKNADSDVNVFNYGSVASITNCSSEVNISLRYGGTREDYLRIIATMPSIWQYAKKANLHTVYIDAQRTGGKFQNGMTNDEVLFIDEFIQFDDVPVVSRDLAAAKKLINLINDDKQDFIIVNKIGGHFPIHDKYPDQYMVYKPVLPRGGFLNITDTGSREGFSGNANDWLKYRNSYRNTILWSVGYFFEEIFTQSDLNKAVIIYTSDHGQDLHEDGKPGVYTHCSINPGMEEGMVPLLVIQGKELKTLDWGKNINSNKDNSSHYNIFPTLLSLMAYNPEKIQSYYGNSLNLQTNDDMTFNSMFHARFGKKPRWEKVQPEKFVVPPECIKGEKAHSLKVCAMEN